MGTGGILTFVARVGSKAELVAFCSSFIVCESQHGNQTHYYHSLSLRHERLETGNETGLQLYSAYKATILYSQSTSIPYSGNFTGANFLENAKIPIVFIFTVFIFALHLRQSASVAEAARP